MPFGLQVYRLARYVAEVSLCAHGSSTAGQILAGGFAAGYKGILPRRILAFSFTMQHSEACTSTAETGDRKRNSSGLELAERSKQCGQLGLAACLCLWNASWRGSRHVSHRW